ncbi:MAG: class I SAM-dependent methyltransferase [Deltaproteobacteria bacterium]|nr:class I SAM-dependent methyltransferase [Deltaproteobacteria bacterium]
MAHRYLVERSRCPACAAEARETLFSCGLLEAPIREHLEALYAPQGCFEPEYLEDGRYELVECGACGLYYQVHVAGGELLGRIYERWIDPVKAFGLRQRSLTLDARMIQAREVVLAVQRHGGTEAPLRVLDYGMGWGSWCQMAMAFGCEAYGVESSPSRVAHARAHGITVVTAEKLGGLRFPFVNCDQVLEHLTEPLEALRVLAGCLGPGGLLKVSVPDGEDLCGRLARGRWLAAEGSPDSLLAVTPLQHVNCFRHENLVGMAARAGLRPAKLTLGELYASSVDGATPGRLVDSLTRPLGRRFLTRDTYVFFERRRAGREGSGGPR